jgi:hypothetical protein
LLAQDIHASRAKTSTIGRTLALRIMTIMMGKSWGPLALTVDWRPYWSEMVARMYNEDYEGKFMTSETIQSSYYRSLALFIYTARRFYATNDPDARFGHDVADVAMRHLENVSTPQFMEGALLLALCLPNEFAHYDELLPQWFAVWGRVNQNSLWDMAWLLVMAHAVKMVPAFDWKPYLPFLFSKLKSLLRLPLVKSAFSFNCFPRVVPSFYQFPFSFYSDFHHTMLFKLTKVISKVVLQDATRVAPEVSVVTLPAAVEEALAQRAVKIPGVNQAEGLQIAESAAQLLQFVHSLRAFVHAAGSGEYTARIAVFITVVLKTFAAYLGGAVGDLLQDDASDAAVFPVRQHAALPTIRYVAGYLLTYVLDSVFVEDPRVNHAFARCIEHLVPVLPDSVHVLCPFFLDALEPRAFQDAAHSMVALKSLGFLLRPALFPQPLILSYLPRLLRLLLQGLEASTPDRINAILYLLYQLFTWLPVSKAIVVQVPAFASYPALLEAPSSAALRALLTERRAPQFQVEYDALVDYVVTDWFPQLLERVFVVTDAEEASVKGAESTAITIAGQLLSIFYQALESPDAAFVRAIAEKIRDYALQRAPAHTDKTCGKLVEYFVSSFPAYQSFFLDALLSSDFVAATMTSERLVFRLRLVGATFRRAAGEPLSPSAQAAFHDAFVANRRRFLHHEDAKVRKMTTKVYKDVLKALTAVYPLRQGPRFASAQCAQVCLGAPNMAQSGEDVQWFVPTAASMQRAVDLLRHWTDGAVADVTAALADEGPARADDVVGAGLAAIRRLGRGAASVLAFAAPPEASSAVFVRTGRECYVALLAREEDRVYLQQYQARGLRFLADVHRGLEASSGRKGSLANNVFVRKQWMKALSVLVAQRLAVCTDCETYRADLVSTAAMGTSALSDAVYKRFKARGNIQRTPTGADRARVGAQLQCAHYWKRHDWPVHTQSEQVWTQHGLRALFFSFQETHAALAAEHGAAARECLALLLELTRHNYDEIHPQARAYFLGLYDHFPMALRHEYCEQLLRQLYQPRPGFYPMASTLVLLTSRFIELIHTNDALKTQFLLAMPHVVAAAGEEADEEKKEVVLATFTTLFIAYANGWSFPLHALGKARVQDALLRPCLESFGMKLPEDESDAVSGDVLAAKTAWKSRGMRYDTFQGFIVAHLFEPGLLLRGHLSTEVVRFLWRHLTECHDQPTQYIGDVLFFMLVGVLQGCGAEEREQLLAQPWAVYLRSRLNPLARSHDWQGFVVSQVRLALHSLVAGGSNIWTDGVDAVVDVVVGPYLNLTSGRQSRRRTGMPLFSLNFSDSFASLVFTLCDTGLVPLVDGDAAACDVLRAILFDVLEDATLAAAGRAGGAAAHDGPLEARLVNDLRAEVFGGLLRFFFVHRARFGDEQAAVGDLLATYLRAQTEQVNVEFLQDWQEALHFATEALDAEALRAAAGDALVQQIVRDFASTVMMAGANLRSRLFLERQHSSGDEAADLDGADIPKLLRQYSDLDVSAAPRDAPVAGDAAASDDASAASAATEESLPSYDHRFPLALSRQHSLSQPASKPAAHTAHTAHGAPGGGHAHKVAGAAAHAVDSAAPLVRQTSLTSVDGGGAAGDLPPAGLLKRQRSSSLRNPVDRLAPVAAAPSPAMDDDGGDDDDDGGEWEDASEAQTPQGDAKGDADKAPQDGGFQFIDKAFALLRAVLAGLSTSALFARDAADASLWSVPAAVLSFLASAEVDLVVAYTSSRVQLMTIVATLADVCGGRPFLAEALDAIVAKLLQAAAADGGAHGDADVGSEGDEAPRPAKKARTAAAAAAAASVAEVDGGADGATKRRQYAVESVSVLLTSLWHMTNAADCARPVALRCLPTLIEALDAAHNETVQEAVAALFTFALGILQVDDARDPAAAVEGTLQTLQPYLSRAPLWHDNWRVREVLLRLGMALQSWLWHCLGPRQRQAVKDVIVGGLKDPQRQVQDAALTAMPDYLALKSDAELKVIAEAYLRNSETLLLR